MTTEEIAKLLTSEGWLESPDQFKKEARMFYKQFATPTRCHGNDDKAGIQVCLWAWPPFGDGRHATVDLGICAGLKDGSWIKLEPYVFHEKTLDEVLATIPRLISTWEHIANYQL